MAYSKAILLLGLLVLVVSSEVFARELAEESVQTTDVKEDGYGYGGGHGHGHGHYGGGHGGHGGHGRGRPPVTKQESASELAEESVQAENVQEDRYGYEGRGGYNRGHGRGRGGYGRGRPPVTKQESASETEAGEN